MANFFKSTCSNTLSEKGYPNSKMPYSSSRFSYNVTKNTNVPVVSQFDQNVTISPLSKEIHSRLKVLNEILPHEDVVQLSQDFINRLNSACFDKIAEGVRSNFATTSTLGGASTACSSVSQRINAQSRPLPIATESNKESNKDTVSQMMLKAAKNIRSQSNLGIISEEPPPVELRINTSRENSKVRGRTQITKNYTTVAPSNEDDSMCFRKPGITLQNRKQRSNQKKTESSVVRNNPRKKKLYDPADLSIASCDLTITKTSLRSAGSRKNAVPSNKQENLSRKIEKRNIKTKELDIHYEDENPEKSGNDSALMLRIQSRPKKTALSPFFNRFKKRCSAGKTTSTPFKL